MALPEITACLSLSGNCSPLLEASPLVSTADGLLELLQLRESYSQLQERYAMMENAARAEISELRTRLQEAHQRLAEMRTEQTVSGVEVQVSAQRSLQAGIKQAEQTAFLARSEVRQKLEDKLQNIGVRRLIRHRTDCLQLRCVVVWRTLVVLGGRRRLEQLEQPGSIVGLHRALLWTYNCWRAWFELVYSVPERYEPHANLQQSLLLQEHVRRQHHADQQIFRHQVCNVFGIALRHVSRRSTHMKHVFIAWQLAVGREDRTRLRRLVDLAHDSWHVSVMALHRVVNDHSYSFSWNIASRCFAEWSLCYRRHRGLAHLWRWLGKERRFVRRCFSAFLQARTILRMSRNHWQRAVQALAISERQRIKALETAPFRVQSKTFGLGELPGRTLVADHSFRSHGLHEIAASELALRYPYVPPASQNL